MGKKTWSRLAAAVLLLYAAGVLAHLAWHPDLYQWDFKIYYYAAQAFAAGLNPYETANLLSLAPELINPRLGFAYQPLTLYYFAPLLGLEFSAAYQAFLWGKVAALTGLFFLWRRWFLDPGHGLWLLLFMMVSFNNTVYADLAAGNISVWEQAVLWPALLLFLRGHLGWFSLLIVLLASIKLVPLLLLGLLFLAEDRRRAYTCLALSGLGFAALAALSYLSHPSLFIHFLTQGQGMLTERGVINPSTLAFLTAGVTQAEKMVGFSFPGWMVIALYAAVATAVLTVSVWALRLWQQGGHPDRNRVAVLFGCVVYALLAPRLKNYSYILLVAPAFFILWRSQLGATPYFLLTLMLFSPYPSLPGIEAMAAKLLPYYSLFLAYLVWGLYVRYILQKCRRIASAQNLP